MPENKCRLVDESRVILLFKDGMFSNVYSNPFADIFVWSIWCLFKNYPNLSLGFLLIPHVYM